MKWVMVITLLIISSDVFSQVRGTNWGDSLEQVEETIDDELNYLNEQLERSGLDKVELTDRLKYKIVMQLTNFDTTLVRYSFLDEKLGHILVIYNENQISIDNFNDTYNLLKIKYGDPLAYYINDNQVTEFTDNWNRDLDENLVKMIKELKIIWTVDETMIEFRMNDIETVISYGSRLFLSDIEEERNKSITNDF